MIDMSELRREITARVKAHEEYVRENPDCMDRFEFLALGDTDDGEIIVGFQRIERKAAYKVAKDADGALQVMSAPDWKLHKSKAFGWSFRPSASRAHPKPLSPVKEATAKGIADALDRALGRGMAFSIRA